MTTQPVAVSARVERRYDLTRLQAEVWSSQRLYPNAAVANMATAHRITGPVDPDRFVEAFDLVVRACDVLRTVVGDGAHRANAAEAAVLAAPPLRTEVIDLDPMEVDSWCAQRVARPIDVTTCCYDSVLLRHADDDWTWWLDLHHLVTDATSQTLVHHLTSLAYDGAEVSAASYADFASAQAADADDAATPSTTDAPPPPPPLRPFGARGATTTVSVRRPVAVDGVDLADVPAQVAAAYPSISPDLSLAAVFAAALACTMQRLDGRSEFSIGFPVGNRTDRRRRDLVGPLMELHPVRVVIEPGDTFASLVERTLASVIGMLRATRRDPDGDRGDFEMVVNVFRGEYGTFASHPVSVSWVRAPHVDPAHSVRLHAFDWGNDLEIELDVNDALVGDGTPARLDRYVARVIDQMLDDPTTPIGSFSIATDEDLDHLAALVPAVPERVDIRPVHERIAERLRSEPDRVVAEDRHGAASAADFDRRVERCRSWLRDEGVVAGDRVGLRMSRSVDVLVAIQAVLRSGAAFVMLDPSDPEARHEAIATDAGLRMIVDDLAVIDGRVDEADSRLEATAVDPDDIAYILYTSGSTGLPKGVPISHRGLTDYLDFAVEAYRGDGEPPVVALHSALIFDLTITSLFLSFVTGGTVVVFDGDPVVALGRIAADDRITLLKATPVAARDLRPDGRHSASDPHGRRRRGGVPSTGRRRHRARVPPRRADLQRVRADRSGRRLHDPRVGSGRRSGAGCADRSRGPRVRGHAARPVRSSRSERRVG